MRHRRRANYLLVHAAASVGGLLAVLVFNWLVDPLQLYHRPFLQNTFVDNQRYQNPGLAKNYRYDAVIIGSSHTENFSPKQIQSVLGWRTLPLSISGSTAREQRLILEKALETGQVRHVLWGIDFRSFRCEPDEIRHDGGEFPMYLYHEDLSTPLRYLLSLDTLGFSRKVLTGKGRHDLETLHAWPERYEFNEERVIAAWQHERTLPSDKLRKIGASFRGSPREALLANVRENLAALVASHPETEFHLFFPPYSALAYTNDFAIAADRFEERLAFKREIVRTLAQCKNCKLHDFEIARAITHDLNNYKDLEHYHRRVNDWIVESIARDEFRLTLENSATRLAEFEQDVHEFVRAVLVPNNPLSARLNLAHTPLSFRDNRAVRVATDQHRAPQR